MKVGRKNQKKRYETILIIYFRYLLFYFVSACNLNTKSKACLDKIVRAMVNQYKNINTYQYRKLRFLYVDISENREKGNVNSSIYDK